MLVVYSSYVLQATNGADLVFSSEAKIMWDYFAIMEWSVGINSLDLRVTT